jgi:hypothetical protein
VDARTPDSGVDARRTPAAKPAGRARRIGPFIAGHDLLRASLTHRPVHRRPRTFVRRPITRAQLNVQHAYSGRRLCDVRINRRGVRTEVFVALKESGVIPQKSEITPDRGRPGVGCGSVAGRFCDGQRSRQPSTMTAGVDRIGSGLLRRCAGASRATLHSCAYVNRGWQTRPERSRARSCRVAGREPTGPTWSNRESTSRLSFGPDESIIKCRPYVLIFALPPGLPRIVASVYKNSRTQV